MSFEQANDDIERLIAAFYAAFDNRGARQPSAGTLRAMFSSSARITRVTSDGAEIWPLEGFILPRLGMLTDGTLVDFHEWEVEARTIVLDNIAGRWSSYEKEGKLNGASYCGKGNKFIQVFRNENRWLINSILWEDVSS